MLLYTVLVLVSLLVMLSNMLSEVRQLFGSTKLVLSMRRVGDRVFATDPNHVALTFKHESAGTAYV